MAEHYDDLVIGAGSAGAVLASRLSEDPDRRVLLIESGPALPTTPAAAAAVQDASAPAVAPGLNWDIETTVRHAAGRGPAATFTYRTGRIAGGSSAVNAAQALRATPDDFAKWAAASGGAWEWDEVLPYYRKLENDPVGDPALHGRSGPVPIRRLDASALSAEQAGLLSAGRAEGFANCADHNDPESTGVGVVPRNVVDGVRISTVGAYLTAALRRPNLTLLAGAHADRLRFTGTRCTGAEVLIDGERRSLTAGRTVLCAGALHTPAILLRSGIGAPSPLEELGIPVRVALPGVGRNLMDHPVVTIWAVPTGHAPQPPMREVLLRHTSGLTGHRNDVHISMMSGADASLVPTLHDEVGVPAIAGMSVCLMASRSRGHLTLRSSDALALPQVVVGCLTDDADLAPLVDGVRLAWRLMRHPALSGLLRVVPAWTQGLIDSDVALRRAVTAFARPGAHVAGTAALGLSPDDGAVVTPRGQVYGVDQLWVADASIMPTIPSAPTNLTCIMIGERIAAELRSPDRQRSRGW